MIIKIFVVLILIMNLEVNCDEKPKPLLADDDAM